MNERNATIVAVYFRYLGRLFLGTLGPILLAFLPAQAEGLKLSLTGDINSSAQELSPVISTDGKLLFFCREGAPQNVGFKQRKHDQDIWLARRLPDGSFGVAEHLEAPFNTVGYDFPVAFFSESQTLYLGNTYTPDGKSAPGISRSRLVDGKFSFPEPLEIEDFYNDVNLVAYSVAADEKTLIMSLQRKDSRGKSDLYVSFLRPNGKWSKPLNLGDDVNTPAAELTPYLASDNRTLYFASDREGGSGKFDLYMTRREGESFTRWSTPKNLGRTINTGGSEISMALTPDGTQVVYASDTPSGGKDLRIQSLPEKFQPLKFPTIHGVVVDLDGSPLAADVFAEKLGSEKTVARTKSILPDGKFTVTVPPGLHYGLHAQKEGYAPVSVSVDLVKHPGAAAKAVRLTLVPLQAGNKIRLNHVFFATNSAQLDKNSHSELNRLVLLMQANRSLRIEIGGHTDNVGTAAANMRLSARRAAAVRQYLLAQGVDKKRITARGYGETKPVADNASEAGRRLNRRVEFGILGL